MPTLDEQVAALTTATTDLTNAVNIQKTALDSKVSQAATSATSAATDAGTATAKAAAAATSATNAATSATNAAASATDANAAKTAAQTAANIATNAGTNIQASIDAAALSATNAANSATSASTSATTATNQATISSNNAAATASDKTATATNVTAAQNARIAAESAQSAATTQANNAATSATNAATSATGAAASAQQAASSAAAAASSAASGGGSGGGGVGTLPATTYYYVITATNANGETVKSNEQSVVASGSASTNSLSWVAVNGATGYKIYRGTVAGGENVFYSVGPITSFTDTGASSTPGTPPATNTTGMAAPVQNAITTVVGGTLAEATYYYVVTALTAAGETTKSNEASVATIGANSSVTVTWTAVPGATGYNIYRGTASGGQTGYYAVGAVTSFTDTGAAITAGSPPASNTARIPTPVQSALSTSITGGTGLAASTAYSYVVTALNAQGETVKSNELTISTAAPLATPVQAAPTTANTGGTLTPGTYYYVVAATNAAGETIKSNEQSIATQAALATPVQATPTTATTGGTLAAATYYYVVTATDASGETIKSNEQSIATTGTTSANTISWAAITGATGYRIYRGTATGGENVFYSVGAVTSFMDTGAANTAGTPPASNTTGTKSTVTVSWAAITGATGYKIYRGTTAGGENVFYSVGAVTTFTDSGAASTAGTPSATNTTAASSSIVVSWGAVTGATGYRIYRGTAAGAENVYYSVGTVTSFTDTGAASTAGTPPATGTALVTVPIQSGPTTIAGGALAAATYYYVVSATNAVGETLKSNELSIVTAANSRNRLSWAAILGATGYRIYRGTTAGGENVYYATTATTFDDIGGTTTAGSPSASNTSIVAAPSQNAAVTAPASASGAGSLVPPVTASVFSYPGDGSTQNQPYESQFAESFSGTSPNRVLTVTTQLLPTVRTLSKEQADRQLAFNFTDFMDGSRWLNSCTPTFNNLNLYITQLAKAMKARLQDNNLQRTSIRLDMPRGLWPFADQAVLTEYVRLNCRGFMLRAPGGTSDLMIGQRPMLAMTPKSHLDYVNLVCNALGSNPGSGVVIGKVWEPTAWSFNSTTYPGANAGTGFAVNDTVTFMPNSDPYDPLVFTVTAIGAGGSISTMTLNALANGRKNHVGFHPNYMPLIDMESTSGVGTGAKIKLTDFQPDFLGDGSNYRWGQVFIVNWDIGTINTFGTSNLSKADMATAGITALNANNGDVAAVSIHAQNLDIDRLNIYNGYYGLRIESGSDLRITMVNSVACGWGCSVFGYSSAHITQIITDSCEQGGLQLGSALGFRIGGRLFWEDTNEPRYKVTQQYMIEIGKNGGFNRNLDIDLSLLNAGTAAGKPACYIERTESSTLNIKCSNINYTGGTTKPCTSLYHVGQNVGVGVQLLGFIDNITGPAVTFATFYQDAANPAVPYSTDAHVCVYDSNAKGIAGPSGTYQTRSFGDPATTFGQGKIGRAAKHTNLSNGDTFTNRGTSVSPNWVRDVQADSAKSVWLQNTVGIGAFPHYDAAGPRLILSRNANANPAGTGGYSYQVDAIQSIYGADGQQPRSAIEAFANSGLFTVRRANGTLGAPTALASGDAIGGMAFFGRLGTLYGTTAAATILARAAQAFTDTAAGANIDIETMANGTVTRRVIARFSEAGDMDLRAGGGVRLKEGTNGRAGVATLVNGTVTVSNTLVTSNSRITLDRQNAGGTLGHLSTVRTAGTGFTINSSSATETSTVYFTINEPSV